MSDIESTPAVADHVPARMVNEFVYCPRLAYLEWVQGEWDDNLDTIHGKWVHRRVDDEPATAVAGPDDGITGADGSPSESTVRIARSVLLSSERLGAIARIDLLEAAGRRATPVEYKRGAAPTIAVGAWDPERVQVCLQGLILRDNGYEVDGGVIYFAESKSRVPVQFDEELVALTEGAIAGLRRLASDGKLPPPLVDSPKCPRCSLNAICLPDETRVWAGVGVDNEEVRRLVPARPEGLPLHVQVQGAVIAKRDANFLVTAPDEAPTSVRAIDVSSVACYGNVQVTTQALRAFCDDGIAVTFHSASGWLNGVMNAGVGHKNVEVRVRQHAIASDPASSLALAHRMVAGKIQNQRTQLRRNAKETDRRILGAMAWQARQARGAVDTAQLMGMEGMAARHYFAEFPRMLRGAGEWACARFAESGRNRRPPRDEVNALLSFLYALLVRDCTLAALVTGFDPYVGFLHSPRYGRPSLALDLAEEFRPIIADSVAVRALNQGEVVVDSFVRRARGVALTPAGRRAIIRAYERRLSDTVNHPVFGYVVSYRRVIELQARLLRAVVLGEAGVYRPFSTR